MNVFSPNKPKNGGITAGIARAGAGKDSALGNGVDDSEEVRNPNVLKMLLLVIVGHHDTASLHLSIVWVHKIACFSFL